MDGVWYWDIENPESEWLSPRFKELFGFEDHEMPNTTEWWQKNIHPDDLQVVIENFHKHCENPDHPYDQIVRYRHRNGSTVWVRCRGIAIRDETGRAIRMLGAHTDITALKEAEARIQENQEKLRKVLLSLTKAQQNLVEVERLKALGQLSSGVAHELNNILIKLLSKIELSKHDHPDLREDFAVMQSLAVEGGKVLGRMRHFHARRTVPDSYQAVPLLPLVAETVEITKPKWKSELEMEGTHLDMRVSIDPDLAVMGDPAQLREVFTNLVFNACDALEGQGAIVITADEVEEVVSIQVEDNGSGMSAETLSQCTEPLYTTRAADRSGLGLSLAKGIALSCGGDLTVESELGQGTRVTVRLPAAKMPQSPVTVPPASMDPEAMPLKSVRVLLVDDEFMVTEIVGQLLRISGFECEAVNTGAEALALLETKAFDVVVTDRSMPGINGDELALHVSRNFSTIPVIMATGYGEIMKANREVPEGVALVLPKPFTNEALRDAIHTVARESGVALTA